jgi:hypothetical protein
MKEGEGSGIGEGYDVEGECGRWDCEEGERGRKEGGWDREGG